MKGQRKHEPKQSRVKRRALIVLLTVSILTGCTNDKPTRVSTGAFHQLEEIPLKLRRGIARTEDVKVLLGEPTGRGYTILPPEHNQYEILYYQDMEFKVHEEKQSMDESGTTLIIPIDVRQQILLIFLRGGVFEGYLWTSNVGAGTGYVQYF